MARTPYPERLTDLERIARSYADLCLSAYADDGWDTLRTLRWFNDSRAGLGFQKPGSLGSYVQVSEIHLDEADLATVAARIDELIAAEAV